MPVTTVHNNLKGSYTNIYCWGIDKSFTKGLGPFKMYNCMGQMWVRITWLQVVPFSWHEAYLWHYNVYGDIFLYVWQIKDTSYQISHTIQIKVVISWWLADICPVGLLWNSEIKHHSIANIKPLLEMIAHQHQKHRPLTAIAVFNLLTCAHCWGYYLFTMRIYAHFWWQSIFWISININLISN